jgi:hypothetical protein
MDVTRMTVMRMQVFIPEHSPNFLTADSKGSLSQGFQFLLLQDTEH